MIVYVSIYTIHGTRYTIHDVFVYRVPNSDLQCQFIGIVLYTGINIDSHSRFCWQNQNQVDLEFSIVINMRARAKYELALRGGGPVGQIYEKGTERGAVMRAFIIYIHALMQSVGTRRE